MKCKKILSITIIATAFTVIGLSGIYKANITSNINKNISEEVQSEDFLNSENTDDSTPMKILTTTSTDEINQSYKIKLRNISKEKLSKSPTNDSTHYTYTFSGDLILTKDNISHSVEFSSSVLLKKSNLSFEILSVEDLKQDILKEILLINNNISEDTPAELNNTSLVYQNEALDIKIDYPDYWTYTNNQNTVDNIVNDNISFYFNEDKTSNYMLISLSTNPEFDKDILISELTKQNYNQANKLFVNNNGISFVVLDQTFIKDSTESKEIVFIATDKYKSVNKLIVTVKINSTNSTSNILNEIKSALNSIQ